MRRFGPNISILDLIYGQIPAPDDSSEPRWLRRWLAQQAAPCDRLVRRGLHINAQFYGNSALNEL